MTVHDYSQLNTAISVKEQSFLSRTNLVQLLNAVDDEQLALYLEGTPYNVPLAEATRCLRPNHYEGAGGGL